MNDILYVLSKRETLEHLVLATPSFLNITSDLIYSPERSPVCIYPSSVHYRSDAATRIYQSAPGENAPRTHTTNRTVLED